MQDLQDYELIRNYVENDSETAFAMLVERYRHFVYAIAVREADDPALAEDIAQVVFIILARKANTLHKGTILSGWLFNTTRFVAKNLLRQEARRQQREYEAVAEADCQTARSNQQAWDHLEPLLHQALSGLRQGERNALLLRFLEGKSLREVGHALAISEDAAQKRVTRALEKLRCYLAQHGYTITAALIGAMLSKNLARAAPTVSVTSVLHSLSSHAGARAVAHFGSGTLRLGSKLVASANPVQPGASPQIYTLAEGALRAMLISQIKVGVVASLGLSLAATSVDAIALKAMANTGVDTHRTSHQQLAMVPMAKSGHAKNREVMHLPPVARPKTTVRLALTRHGSKPQPYFMRSAAAPGTTVEDKQVLLPTISYVSLDRPNSRASGLIATRLKPLGIRAQLVSMPRVATTQAAIVTPLADTAARPQANPEVKGKPLDNNLAAAIAQAEQELNRVTVRYQAGVATTEEVQQANSNLADAHTRFATSHNQPEIAVQEAQKLVDAKAQIVTIANARYQVGAATAMDLNAAQIALTKTRIRLQIYTLINLQTRNLKSVTVLYNQGAATQKEVAAATKAVADARSRLVEGED